MANNQNKTSLLIGIIVLFIFEYFRSIANSSELVFNLIITILMTIVMIAIDRKGFGKPTNLGIITIIIFILEYFRSLEQYDFLTNLVFSGILLIVAKKLNDVK